MARILLALTQQRITGQSAKKVLQLYHEKYYETSSSVEDIIRQENLELRKLSEEEYCVIAQKLIDTNPQIADKVRKGESGKLMWFVGQMMKQGKGSVEADKAKACLEQLLANTPI